MSYQKESRPLAGMLSFSKDQEGGLELEDGSPIFTVIVDAIRDGYLSDVISVTNKVAEAEAYESTGEELDVVLEFDKDQQIQDGFALYQNRPNPFLSKTIIGFYLPNAARASITVFDAAGRMLKTYRGDYVKGYNEIEVKYEDLNARGVLYYQLDTEDFTASRKMLVVE